MKRTGWLVLAALLALVIGSVGCITEDEASKKHGRASLTWEEVARLIDNQMKQISDGKTNVDMCANNGAAIGLGNHCRNQLAGSVSTGSVLQLVRINRDLPFFFGDLTLPGPRAPIIHQGFQAQTNNPCLEDLLPAPGTPDVFDPTICQNGAGHVACTNLGNNAYTLLYTQCLWVEGAVTWVLDGRVTYNSFSTSADEIVNVATLNAFSMTDNAVPHASLLMSGNAARYQVINPITGAPAAGTTPHVPPYPDGMDIFNASITVDTDGAAGAILPSSYVVDFATDFEDGLILLNGTAGVWPKNPAVIVPNTIGVNFFASGKPYNLTWPGCLLDITFDPDPTKRAFNITGQIPYGVNACLPDSTAEIKY